MTSWSDLGVAHIHFGVQGGERSLVAVAVPLIAPKFAEAVYRFSIAFFNGHSSLTGSPRRYPSSNSFDR